MTPTPRPPENPVLPAPAAAVPDSTSQEEHKCKVCSGYYPANNDQYWQTLACSHKICNPCYYSMMMLPSAHQKCPFSGEALANCHPTPQNNTFQQHRSNQDFQASSSAMMPDRFGRYSSSIPAVQAVPVNFGQGQWLTSTLSQGLNVVARAMFPQNPQTPAGQQGQGHGDPVSPEDDEKITPGVAIETATSTFLPDGQVEECVICCTDSNHWQTLPCAHKLCGECYTKITVSGVTMAGVSHTSVKCPFCQVCYGVQVGTCPTGTMTTAEIRTVLPGHEPYNTITIHYHISGWKYFLNRVAYLPNSPEGKRVLELLKVAWDRRHCFTIGTSITTGVQDTVVWNIHHKTSVSGGIQHHGYPDESYLERVQDELKQYGLE